MAEEILKRFGGRLKMLRIKKGVTPLQFYDATGIEPHILGKYENGELEPKLGEVLIIADALKISHLELMNFDTDLDNP